MINHFWVLPSKLNQLTLIKTISESVEIKQMCLSKNSLYAIYDKSVLAWFPQIENFYGDNYDFLSKYPYSYDNFTKKIVKVYSNNNIYFAISEEGSVFSWGIDKEKKGTLALGFSFEQPKPTLNFNFTKKIIEIALGEKHCAALDLSRNIYTWGVGIKGELGYGFANRETQSIIPTVVNIEKKIFPRKIYCGKYYTAFIDYGGMVFFFGVISVNSSKLVTEDLIQLNKINVDVNELFPGELIIALLAKDKSIILYDQDEGLVRLDGISEVGTLKFNEMNITAFSANSQSAYFLKYDPASNLKLANKYKVDEYSISSKVSQIKISDANYHNNIVLLEVRTSSNLESKKEQLITKLNDTSDISIMSDISRKKAFSVVSYGTGNIKKGTNDLFKNSSNFYGSIDKEDPQRNLHFNNFLDSKRGKSITSASNQNEYSYIKHSESNLTYNSFMSDMKSNYNNRSSTSNQKRVPSRMEQISKERYKDYKYDSTSCDPWRKGVNGVDPLSINFNSLINEERLDENQITPQFKMTFGKLNSQDKNEKNAFSPNQNGESSSCNSAKKIYRDISDFTPSNKKNKENSIIRSLNTLNFNHLEGDKRHNQVISNGTEITTQIAANNGKSNNDFSEQHNISDLSEARLDEKEFKRIHCSRGDAIASVNETTKKLSFELQERENDPLSIEESISKNFKEDLKIYISSDTKVKDVSNRFEARAEIEKLELKNREITLRKDDKANEQSMPTSQANLSNQLAPTIFIDQPSEESQYLMKQNISQIECAEFIENISKEEKIDTVTPLTSTKCEGESNLTTNKESTKENKISNAADPFVNTRMQTSNFKAIDTRNIKKENYHNVNLDSILQINPENAGKDEILDSPPAISDSNLNDIPEMICPRSECCTIQGEYSENLIDEKLKISTSYRESGQIIDFSPENQTEKAPSPQSKTEACQIKVYDTFVPSGDLIELKEANETTKAENKKNLNFSLESPNILKKPITSKEQAILASPQLDYYQLKKADYRAQQRTRSLFPSNQSAKLLSPSSCFDVSLKYNRRRQTNMANSLCMPNSKFPSQIRNSISEHFPRIIRSKSSESYFKLRNDSEYNTYCIRTKACFEKVLSQTLEMNNITDLFIKERMISHSEKNKSFNLSDNQGCGKRFIFRNYFSAIRSSPKSTEVQISKKFSSKLNNRYLNPIRLSSSEKQVDINTNVNSSKNDKSLGMFKEFKRSKVSITSDKRKEDKKVYNIKTEDTRLFKEEDQYPQTQSKEVTQLEFEDSHKNKENLRNVEIEVIDCVGNFEYAEPELNFNNGIEFCLQKSQSKISNIEVNDNKVMLEEVVVEAASNDKNPMKKEVKQNECQIQELQSTICEIEIIQVENIKKENSCDDSFKLLNQGNSNSKPNIRYSENDLATVQESQIKSEPEDFQNNFVNTSQNLELSKNQEIGSLDLYNSKSLNIDCNKSMDMNFLLLEENKRKVISNELEHESTFEKVNLIKPIATEYTIDSSQYDSNLSSQNIKEHLNNRKVSKCMAMESRSIDPEFQGNSPEFVCTVMQKEVNSQNLSNTIQPKGHNCQKNKLEISSLLINNFDCDIIKEVEQPKYGKEVPHSALNIIQNLELKDIGYELGFESSIPNTIVNEKTPTFKIAQEEIQIKIESESLNKSVGKSGQEDKDIEGKEARLRKYTFNEGQAKSKNLENSESFDDKEEEVCDIPLEYFGELFNKDEEEPSAAPALLAGNHCQQVTTKATSSAFIAVKSAKEQNLLREKKNADLPCKLKSENNNISSTTSKNLEMPFREILRTSQDSLNMSSKALSPSANHNFRNVVTDLPLLTPIKELSFRKEEANAAANQEFPNSQQQDSAANFILEIEPVEKESSFNGIDLIAPEEKMAMGEDKSLLIVSNKKNNDYKDSIISFTPNTKTVIRYERSKTDSSINQEIKRSVSYDKSILATQSMQDKNMNLSVIHPSKDLEFGSTTQDFKSIVEDHGMFSSSCIGFGSQENKLNLLKVNDKMIKEVKEDPKGEELGEIEYKIENQGSSPQNVSRKDSLKDIVDAKGNSKKDVFNKHKINNSYGKYKTDVISKTDKTRKVSSKFIKNSVLFQKSEEVEKNSPSQVIKPNLAKNNSQLNASPSKLKSGLTQGSQTAKSYAKLPKLGMQGSIKQSTTNISNQPKKDPSKGIIAAVKSKPGLQMKKSSLTTLGVKSISKTNLLPRSNTNTGAFRHTATQVTEFDHPNPRDNKLSTNSDVSCSEIKIVNEEDNSQIKKISVSNAFDQILLEKRASFNPTISQNNDSFFEDFDEFMRTNAFLYSEHENSNSIRSNNNMLRSSQPSKELVRVLSVQLSEPLQNNFATATESKIDDNYGVEMLEPIELDKCELIAADNYFKLKQQKKHCNTTSNLPRIGDGEDIYKRMKFIANDTKTDIIEEIHHSPIVQQTAKPKKSTIDILTNLARSNLNANK